MNIAFNIDPDRRNAKTHTITGVELIGMASPAFPKVLFFQHSNHAGGAPRSLLQIIYEFEKEFGPQRVLFIRPGPVLETYAGLRSEVACGRFILPFHGSEVSGMNFGLAIRNIIGIFMAFGVYIKYLRGYDVIYMNSSSLCFYGVVTKIISPSTKIIYHIREPLLKNIWGKVIRHALRRSADYVIAISTNEMRNLNLPDVAGEVVYNYVHSQDYVIEYGRSLHRSDPAVGPEKFTVGYFARVDFKNGLQDFLNIANKFESDPSMAFCIYGYTGQEGSQVKEAISKAGRNVHIYPMVSNVPQNLGDLNVLLVPFRTPHFSRSVIEAAMLKVPSIIYDLPSVNETVVDRETGFVVPFGDTSMMGERLKEIRNSQETLNRLAEGARKLALRDFSEKNYLHIRDAIIAE
jgi:glycosyltransferase involved in cell wall biosynthesis